jgi:hypothetical protein
MGALSTTNTPPPFDFASACSAVAKSGLGGIRTPEQALTLASIALADDAEASDSPISFLRALGKASRDFHIISGKPALKADAMLARFQAAGGTVQWGEYTDTRCEGTFSHPKGGTITLDWTMERAKHAGLVKDGPWKAHPRAMLRARVISEAIRTIFPGVISGLYTDDEIRESTPAPAAAPALAAPANDRNRANQLYTKLAIADKAEAENIKAASGGDLATFISMAEARLAELASVSTDAETVTNEDDTNV